MGQRESYQLISKEVKIDDFSVSEIKSPTRTIILIGRFGQGKTWLCKTLIDDFSIDTSVINTKVHTYGIKLYQLNNNYKDKIKSSVLFLDSEGLEMPDRINNDNLYNLNSLIRSLVSCTEGMILFLCKDFTNLDIQYLQSFIPIISENRRLIIIHNRSDHNMLNLQHDKKDLLDLKDPEINVFDNSFYSKINNITMEHIILLQHKNIDSMNYNRLQFKKILTYANIQEPKNIELNLMIMDDHYKRLISGVFHSIYFSRLRGTKHLMIEFRPLTIEEEKELSETCDPTHFKVLNIRTLNCVSVSIENNEWPHFVNLTLENEIAEKENLLVWTPWVIVRCYKIIKNSNQFTLISQIRI